MKKYPVILFLIILIFGCKESVKETVNQNQVYGNSTENTKVSSDKIDNSRTYEISFTLDKPAECMTIDIESALLQKTFPVQKVPRKTYFNIEKKLNPAFSKFKNVQAYTPLGRNYTNDWELYSPVKICSSRNDPLSTLDASEYRIRFTAFEKERLYYIISITCESKILYTESVPPAEIK